MLEQTLDAFFGRFGKDRDESDGSRGRVYRSRNDPLRVNHLVQPSPFPLNDILEGTENVDVP